MAAVAFVDVMVVRGPAYHDRVAINAQLQIVNGTTGCDCWWPVWATSGALAQSERVVAGGRAIEIDKWEPKQRSFTVRKGVTNSASIATFYYPRWHAVVNGQAADVRIGNHGQIVVPLPSEVARVELRFVEPSYVGWAKVVSACAWLGLLALFIHIWRNKLWST